MVGQFDDLVKDATPLVGMVIDDEHSSVMGHPGDLITDRRSRLLVEHGNGLIKQQQPGIGGEDPGDGEALHLAAGHLRSRVVHGHGEPGSSLGILDDRPDVLTRDTMVLRAKSDVSSACSSNDGVDRFLLQQSDVHVAGPRVHPPGEVVALFLQ